MLNSGIYTQNSVVAIRNIGFSFLSFESRDSSPSSSRCLGNHSVSVILCYASTCLDVFFRHSARDRLNESYFSLTPKRVYFPYFKAHNPWTFCNSFPPFFFFFDQIIFSLLIELIWTITMWAWFFSCDKNKKFYTSCGILNLVTHDKRKTIIELDVEFTQSINHLSAKTKKIHISEKH